MRKRAMRPFPPTEQSLVRVIIAFWYQGSDRTVPNLRKQIFNPSKFFLMVGPVRPLLVTLFFDHISDSIHRIFLVNFKCFIFKLDWEKLPKSFKKSVKIGNVKSEFYAKS